MLLNLVARALGHRNLQRLQAAASEAPLPAPWPAPLPTPQLTVVSQRTADAERLLPVEQVLQALQTLQIERDAALAQLQQAQWLGKIGHWESDAAVGSLVCSEVVRQARRRGAAFDLQLQLLLPSGQLRRLE